jgi:hypothetical protein
MCSWPQCRDIAAASAAAGPSSRTRPKGPLRTFRDRCRLRVAPADVARPPYAAPADIARGKWGIPGSCVSTWAGGSGLHRQWKAVRRHDNGRLRRGPSPPLQHQRKLGCLVEPPCTTRRSTDASYRCISVSAPTSPKFAPDEGQSSRPQERRTRGTRHAHRHYYQLQSHTKTCVLFWTTEDIPTPTPVLEISNFWNLKNKIGGVAHLKIEVVCAHVRTLPRSSGVPASWPRHILIPWTIISQAIGNAPLESPVATDQVLVYTSTGLFNWTA